MIAFQNKPVKICSFLAILIYYLPGLSLTTVEKDYSDEAYGIIANLETQTVLRPIFHYHDNIRMMPLGDSITAGEHRVEPVPGAYRLRLGNYFQSHQLIINWVGTLQNPSLTPDFDGDHEGHGGWKISQIKHMINNNLSTYQQTDIVLLMIGTNDFLGSAMAQDALNDLEALLNILKRKVPEVKIFVSDIPPINPQGSKESANSQNAQQVADFNGGLAAVVSQVASPNIIYVTVGSQLDLEDINPDGVHPTKAGYNKMANLWYETLLRPAPLKNIQNLLGSHFNDVITGNETSNLLVGQGGDDWLCGTSATLAGANEQDVLSGGAGADRFILGDTVQAYYAIRGDRDFVRILDFDAREDALRLHGVADDYRFVQQGNDVYLKLAKYPELIAVLEHTSVRDLSPLSFEFIHRSDNSKLTTNNPPNTNPAMCCRHHCNRRVAQDAWETTAVGTTGLS
jgi:lysophospholipase L1-like esterase